MELKLLIIALLACMAMGALVGHVSWGARRFYGWSFWLGLGVGVLISVFTGVGVVELLVGWEAMP